MELPLRRTLVLKFQYSTMVTVYDDLHLQVDHVEIVEVHSAVQVCDATEVK